MSTYLQEVSEGRESRGEEKFRDTQHAMADQAVEIAKRLRTADVADGGEEEGALADYLDAAVAIIAAQANGLALRRIQYTLRDILDFAKLTEQAA